jgi:DNA polymerase III alpha subunit
MTKFAEYGFNKSHTAAYAVVTYHTAWLKAHHCAAFMAATMSSDLDNTDTVKIFYDDTVANGIKVLPPDVNASDYRFVPVDRKTIRYGLGAVKGTGGRAGGARDPRSAPRRAGRSRICSTSACASTSAWSTAASSRR